VGLFFFLSLFPLDGIVDFFAMNGNFSGGINAKPDLIASDIYDGDLNVIANNN